jgi:DNA-binding SARP family transcriptional activator
MGAAASPGNPHPSARSRPAPHRIRLDLLDGFELSRNGEVLRLPRGAQRLLAFSALQDRSPLRMHVAGVLWPDSSELRSRANLRSALWRLRRVEPRLMAVTRSHLSLSTDLVVDYRESLNAARRLLESDADAPGVDSLEALLAGDLLPDWDEEWLQVQREHLRQLRLHALERMCEQLIAAGRFGRAVEAGLLAVTGDPLRETAHRVLIRAYAAEGNRSEAVRQYRRYRRLLRDELGVEPAQETRALVPNVRAR